MIRYLVVVGSMSWMTATAAAQPRILTWEGGVLGCEPITTCADVDDCPEPFAACGPLGGAGNGCHNGPLTPLCCTTSADCTAEDASTGVQVTGECVMTAGAGISGLCQYARVPTFCDPTDLDAVLRCLTEPGGEAANEWTAGDCDGDGTNNSDEVAPGCDHCDASDYPDEMRECTGPSRSDAGVDASVSDSDAGRGTADASVADGGRTGSGTGDDGGCGCSVQREGAEWFTVFLSVALIAAGIRRRRR